MLESSSVPPLSPNDKPTDRTAEILWRVLLAMRFLIPGAMLVLFSKAYFGW
jgi:hypothetical protein